MFTINNSMEYDDIRHKKKCDEEHYNEKQHKREHDDERHKRKQEEKQHKREHDDERHKKKQDKNQHKKDYNDERHKRKHNKEHHKKDHDNEPHKRKHHRKNHDEEHHKRDHDDNLLQIKPDKIYFTERDLFNFFKTYSVENDKYVPLEKNSEDKKPDISKEDDIDNNVEGKNLDLSNEDHLESNVEDGNYNLSKEDTLEKDIEDKNYDLFKDDDLENNVENENCNLSKDDSLENKNYTCFGDLHNEDFLEENHNAIVNEEVLEENHNTIEAEEFSKDTLNNKVDEVQIVNCKTRVTSEILTLCDNITHTSEVTVEPVTVKIPVVLTECTITITVESSLKLEDVVLEIKHIRKNVYLNQCELIPSSEDGKPNTGILFVDGFIRKNIEYSTKDHNDNGVSCGKVKHVTVNVPFKCTTRVMFKTYPKFKPNNYQDEVKILQTSIEVYKPCEEDIIGEDIREQSFKIIEYFNEKVFCELISAEIIESDIIENSINKECKIPLEGEFHNITEKVVLSLTIKLLQNQHVDISKKS
ncbi:MAG: CsxC family protein [Clostridium sp.]|uniref:CsxC family protein n=1 Tax=Clostridium sp. TaxID=1506 RepID=UPI003D6D36EF